MRFEGNEIDNKRLGRNLFHERKRKGLTGDKLAEICGVQGSYIRQIECGRKLPSITLFVIMCDELNITPDRLLKGITKRNSDSPLNSLPNEVQSKLLKIANIIEDYQNEGKVK